MGFIIDIRRQNLLTILLHKALFGKLSKIAVRLRKLRGSPPEQQEGWMRDEKSCEATSARADGVVWPGIV